MTSPCCDSQELEKFHWHDIRSRLRSSGDRCPCPTLALSIRWCTYIFRKCGLSRNIVDAIQWKADNETGAGGCSVHMSPPWLRTV